MLVLLEEYAKDRRAFVRQLEVGCTPISTSSRVADTPHLFRLLIQADPTPTEWTLMANPPRVEYMLDVAASAFVCYQRRLRWESRDEPGFPAEALNLM